MDWEIVLDSYRNVRNLRDETMVFRVNNVLSMVEWRRFLPVNHFHNDMGTLSHIITVSEIMYVCYDIALWNT